MSDHPCETPRSMIERSEPPSPDDKQRAGGDGHLALLRLLERHPEYSQRELAAMLNVSLGKTHYLLKALLAKGWVKANNFRRSDNKTFYANLFTTRGTSEKLRMTRSFLRRKEAEFDALRQTIAGLRTELINDRLDE